MTAPPSSAPAPSTTTSAPALSLPSRDEAATPHPTLDPVEVEAGSTQLRPAGPARTTLEITLPDGWSKAADSTFVKETKDRDAGLSFSAWRLDHVFVFPCRWASREFADPSLLRTLNGTAEALSAWWGQDPTRLSSGNSELAPLATEPQRSSFHGYLAWYLQVLIPLGLDLTECDGSQLVLWEAASGEVQLGVPGELHWLYLVDVNGEFIVLDAASLQATSVVDRAELQAVLDSVVIDR